MPIGTARERRRRRCSAGRRPCDARTPQRCTRSALVPFRHPQASPTPRPCVVAWIQADVGGTVPPSHLGGQRAAELADEPLCAACVLPVSADGSGVPISQQLRGPPSAREVLIIAQCGQRAAGTRRRKMAQKRTQYTAGVTGHARQTVADGRFRRTRREGPIHIPVTRRHASTNCACSCGDRSECDADCVTDEWFACCRGRAQTQAQQYRSTADPRERGRGAAMPRGITGLGSRGYQAALHGPPAAWRSHGGGHDCGPPVCGALQLGAGCRCNTLGLLHSVRPHSCGNVTAAARTVPQCISNHVVTAARDVSHTPRCKHSSQLHAG
ncbi:hypothetical protein TCDM_12212 [Trypanosoma cruzi Dm28c]|uniref:Uncharacterized protein n=1 Tax=Trypanosoma cruzi Dm28c TaxID=1416333 RepID=V5AH28_TRYCR|nr:hypothetical protein TCDM_12212 [Trypanosoma cruzi Dm28c]